MAIYRTFATIYAIAGMLCLAGAFIALVQDNAIDSQVLGMASALAFFAAAIHACVGWRRY